MKMTVYYSNKDRDTVETLKLLFAVKRASKFTLEYMNFPSDVELSVVFCRSDYIREINRKFRGIDAPTDVLSFPLNDFTKGRNPKEGLCELGDIVINLDAAKKQAEEIGHPYENEVVFLAVHSTLHLLGIDHELSPSHDEFMRELQRAIMKGLGYRK